MWTSIAPGANGVFVAPGGAGTACTASAPCGSIGAGINTAVSNHASTVYVAAGTYVEVVTLPVGITVQGGWKSAAGAWTQDCSATAGSDVVIQAPSTSNITVKASYTGSATLDTLTVQSKASANAGESLYGIFITGTSTEVALNKVTVTVANGGAGNNGMVGPFGVAADAGSSCPPGSGNTGSTGIPGIGGGVGMFDDNGYENAAGQGSSGGSGGAGAAGLAGADAGCVQALNCVYNAPPGCNTVCDCCAYSPIGDAGSSCGKNGTSGCGGGGAGGGTGGMPGGSSIAVYLWGGGLTLTNTTLQAGNGGTGGVGGMGGGMGGAGSMGTAGQEGAVVTIACGDTCKFALGSYTCSAAPTADGGAAGGLGGAGGAGGPGGQGGGGAGGNSYALYVGGGSSPPTVTGNTLTFGTAGQGGSGGSPAAASGVAKAVGP